MKKKIRCGFKKKDRMASQILKTCEGALYDSRGFVKKVG